MDEDQKYMEMAMRFASIIGKVVHVYAYHQDGHRRYAFASEGSALHNEAESSRWTRIATY